MKREKDKERRFEGEESGKRDLNAHEERERFVEIVDRERERG